MRNNIDGRYCAMMESFHEPVIWIVTGSLLLVGLIGTVLPVVPGHLLIFGAGFIPFFALDDRGEVSVAGLIVLGVGLILAQVIDFFSGAVGSRWFGGSKWGAIGAVAGGLLGIFFMPVGLIAGPLLGAFAFEALFAKKDLKPATISGVGSALGTVTGLMLGAIVGLLMIAGLLADILWLN